MATDDALQTAGRKAPKVMIRRAAETDFPDLKRILRETFESTWRPEITLEAARRYLETDVGGTFVDAQGLDFLIAIVDGEVAGLVSWQDDFIDALHVGTRHQRLGIGRALMNEAEKAIRAAGQTQVRLETDSFNARSQAFYRALGYEEKDRYPDLEWESGLTTVLFGKKFQNLLVE
ncbi:N-acetyltransferase [Mesorhizobium sp. 1M-11]|uniref:GNAT family N-acetyltransferase n=1 Tax=Mesorhizobium sp. 1M-11 TaxID=1529006 RepID=UPI0009E9EE02|nr:N-acetyltransferase [Mesorhizobium sp. 1M-11]